MPAVETKIWLALKVRIESLPLLFPVAWPAEASTRPVDTTKLLPYLRIGRVSVSPVSAVIRDGAKSIRTGTLIVTLVHPLLNGAGIDADSIYTEYAGQIAAHFAEGTQMHYGNVCVKVTSQPHVQPGYEDSGYWTVPVSIPWRTFA